MSSPPGFRTSKGAVSIGLAVRRRRPGPPLARDSAVAATETVALVLGEDSPLPDSDQDVADLVSRLRGHIIQLAAELPVQSVPLSRAWQLSREEIPGGYMPSRVYLRKLAQATHDLILARQCVRDGARAARLGWPLADLRRIRLHSRNSARALLFAVAVITLIVAASVPRA
jgi:hypothetical protein